MDVVENAANKGKNAEKLLYNERSFTVRHYCISDDEATKQQWSSALSKVKQQQNKREQKGLSYYELNSNSNNYVSGCVNEPSVFSIFEVRVCCVTG
jgi:DNA topoisomerase VI subunit A